jgi:hypothetical protein
VYGAAWSLDGQLRDAQWDQCVEDRVDVASAHDEAGFPERGDVMARGGGGFPLRVALPQASASADDRCTQLADTPQTVDVRLVFRMGKLPRSRAMRRATRSQPDDGWRRLLARIERIVLEQNPAAVLALLDRLGEKMEQLRG